MLAYYYKICLIYHIFALISSEHVSLLVERWNLADLYCVWKETSGQLSTKLPNSCLFLRHFEEHEEILFIYAGQPRPFCLPVSLSKSRYFHSKWYGSLGENGLIWPWKVSLSFLLSVVLLWRSSDLGQRGYIWKFVFFKGTQYKGTYAPTINKKIISLLLLHT
jgi:hypothetical protein